MTILLEYIYIVKEFNTINGTSEQNQWYIENTMWLMTYSVKKSRGIRKVNITLLQYLLTN